MKKLFIKLKMSSNSIRNEMKNRETKLQKGFVIE